MDMSSGEWLADLGNEDASTIIQHCHRMINSSSVNMEEFDHLLSRQPTDFLFDETTNDFEIVSSFETKPQLHNNKEIKSENGINWNSYTSSNKSSSERIISFGSLESVGNNIKSVIKPEDNVDLVNYESGTSNSNNALVKNNNTVGSTSLCSREHVLAERKRREKMTERFLALSALIPGLKKMDKATILGDAAKYVKQLEEQIKKQEEQITKTRVESVVLVKKTQHLDNNNNNIDDETTSVDQMVDIEARVSNKNVLIRVHSQKKQGLLQCVLNEIANLHMSTLNCITMPFGRYAVDITIIAEIDDDDISMTSNDVVKHLGLALQQFSTL